jgi:hypothetical protein
MGRQRVLSGQGQGVAIASTQPLAAHLQAYAPQVVQQPAESSGYWLDMTVDSWAA